MRVSINGHYLQRKMSGLARYAKQINTGLHDRSYIVTEVTPFQCFYNGKGKIQQLIRFVAIVFLEMFVPPVMLALGRIDAHISPAFSAPIGPFTSRMVVVYHDLAFIEFPTLYSKLERFYLKLNLWILKFGHHQIVTPSEYVKKYLCSYTGISDGRVVVISPYSDFLEKNCTKMNGVKYFISLSNAHPRKNLFATVSGFISSQAPSEGYELLIVGNFELPVELSMKNVRVIKGIPDKKLQDLLSNSAALLLFSLSEGFGFPVVEAARLGVVSLTSEAGSLGELVAPNHKRIVATTEVEIRDKINLFLLSDEYGCALERNRVFVNDKYSKIRFDNAWEGVLSEIKSN